MAVLRFPERSTAVDERAGDSRDSRASLGIDYERWSLDPRARRTAPPIRFWTPLRAEIDEMKQRGGYVTADVIDVNPETPGLDAMLARFDKEHTHSEDEVRFILAGRGIFFLHLDEKVASVEVGPGDMLRVPRGTTHWFTLCEDRRIRAIRWFQDTTGWTPHYTGSGVDGLSAALLWPGVSWARAWTTTSPHDSKRSRSVYLLDVEGTVAPLSLVSEQLFPYARAHFAQFLKKSSGDARSAAISTLLAEENRAETERRYSAPADCCASRAGRDAAFRLDAIVYLTSG